MNNFCKPAKPFKHCSLLLKLESDIEFFDPEFKVYLQEVGSGLQKTLLTFVDLHWT